MEARELNSEFTKIGLEVLYASPTNPRVQHDAAANAELVESVRRLGVLQPILVRPRPPKGIGFEIVAGHRRFAAAQAAGLSTVPALVRQLTDLEVLEIQIVENLQRSDVHPLDEANAYLLLHEQHGVEVARIAERVGRSVPYVYDRMRLTRLVPDAQEQFRAGRFTPAHAVLLARLTPADQHRALDVDNMALYRDEDCLELGDSDDVNDHVKVASVREFAAWITQKVRLSVADEELPQLFPENSEVLGLDDEASDRADLVEVSWLLRVEQPIDGHIYTTGKWHPASPKFDQYSGEPARSCEMSKPGVIVIGPDRGRVLPVCVSKKCPVHFPKKLSPAAAAAEASKPKTAKQLAAEERERKQREAEEAERAKRQHFRIAWEKSEPALLKAVAAEVGKLSTPKLVSAASEMLVECWNDYQFPLKTAKKLLVAKQSPEGVLRMALFLELGRQVTDAYAAPETTKTLADVLKLDAMPIVEAEMAKLLAAEAKAAKKPAKKGGAK